MSARDGYEQAIATLRDVAARTGSPAARWAADWCRDDTIWTDDPAVDVQSAG